MRVGDLVRNRVAVYEQTTSLGARHLGPPIEPGCVGIVLNVRAGAATYGGLAVRYVDVMLSVDGTSVRCVDYGQDHFEVIT